MTKILHFAAAAILACAVMACSESGIEELNPNNPGSNTGNGGNTEPVYITAGFDEGAQSRLIADDDGLTKIVFKWEVGDQIVIGNSLTGTQTAHKFTAISVSDDGKSAMFESPQGYTGTPAIGLRLEKSWNASSFSASTIGGGSGLYAADQLADAYRMYAIYDAEKKRFVFKQLNAIMRFEVTLPATETAINSFRLQVQDQSTVLHTSANYDISSGVAVASDSPENSFYQEGLDITLDNDNKAVVYVSLGPTDAIAQKKLDIIINKTQHTTQTCLALTADKVASIRKPVGKWVNAIYSAGFGTTDSPYIVSNETNLRALAQSTRATTSNSYKDKTFLQENNIEIDAPNTAAGRWIPIGGSAPFEGTFNGNNKTITGKGGTIFVEVEAEQASLFGMVNDAGIVKNITVDANIQADFSAGSLYIGGVCGYIRGKIENCHHIGSVTATGTSIGWLLAGGVCGSAILVEGCTQTNGTVSVKITNPAGGTKQIGGVSGYMLNGKTMHTSKVENTTIETTGISPYVGALVGSASAYGSTQPIIYQCCTYSGVKVIKDGVEQTVVRIGTASNMGVADPQDPCPEHP